jgi:hypothetical protein
MNLYFLFFVLLIIGGGGSGGLLVDESFALEDAGVRCTVITSENGHTKEKNCTSDKKSCDDPPCSGNTHPSYNNVYKDDTDNFVVRISDNEIRITGMIQFQTFEEAAKNWDKPSERVTVTVPVYVDEKYIADWECTNSSKMTHCYCDYIVENFS